MSVTIETEPMFKVGNINVLFEDEYKKSFLRTDYDIHPDNKRFVMIKMPLEILTEMVVVLNWFEELKSLFPTKK